MKVIKHYETDEIQITWQPDLCEHSANCFKALHTVFNPRVRPWVQPEHATTDQIVDAIEQCPSGALSYELLQIELPNGQNASKNDENDPKSAENT